MRLSALRLAGLAAIFMLAGTPRTGRDLVSFRAVSCQGFVSWQSPGGVWVGMKLETAQVFGGNTRREPVLGEVEFRDMAAG